MKVNPHIRYIINEEWPVKRCLSFFFSFDISKDFVYKTKKNHVCFYEKIKFIFKIYEI